MPRFVNGFYLLQCFAEALTSESRDKVDRAHPQKGEVAADIGLERGAVIFHTAVLWPRVVEVHFVY